MYVSVNRPGQEAEPGRDGSMFWAHVESTALTTWAVRRAFALRLLAHQPPAVDVALDCHYCGVVLPSMQKHVFEVCPSYHLIHLHTFAGLLSSSELPLSGTLLEGHTYVPHDGPHTLRFLPNQHSVPPPPPLTGVGTVLPSPIQVLYMSHVVLRRRV